MATIQCERAKRSRTPIHLSIRISLSVPRDENSTREALSMKPPTSFTSASLNGVARYGQIEETRGKKEDTFKVSYFGKFARCQPGRLHFVSNSTTRKVLSYRVLRHIPFKLQYVCVCVCVCLEAQKHDKLWKCTFTMAVRY